MAITVSYTTNPETGELEGKTTHQLSSGGGTVRDTDFLMDGQVKLLEGAAQYASNIDDLQDSDVLEFRGMGVSVGVLRSMGMLDAAWAEAVEDVHEYQRHLDDLEEGIERQPEGPQYDPKNPYDQAIKGLNEALDDNSITLEEAQIADVALANAELKGIGIEAFSEAALAYMEGANDLDLTDVLNGDFDGATLVRKTVDQMKVTMEESARRELGDSGYAELRRLAEISPKVNAAVMAYGVMRATGKAGGARWSDLLADVADFMGYGRE